MNDPGKPSEKELAYFAMIEFLDQYWERGKSDEIAGMLGGMHFTADGATLDPASWHDWENAFAKAQGKTKADYHWKRS